MKDRDYTPRLNTFARTMRSQPTEAERRLWQVLRGGQIEGFHFRRQHPVAGRILDFYCSVLRLAIEADGGQHYLADGRAQDASRDAVLATRGILTLRFGDHDILKNTDGVAETIYARCVQRAAELGRPLRGTRARARARSAATRPVVEFARSTPSLTLPQGGGDKRDARPEDGEQRGRRPPSAPAASSSFLPDGAHSSSTPAPETHSCSSPLGEAGRGSALPLSASTKDFQE